MTFQLGVYVLLQKADCRVSCTGSTCSRSMTRAGGSIKKSKTNENKCNNFRGGDKEGNHMKEKKDLGMLGLFLRASSWLLL